MGQWMPIESAPKETRVWCYQPSYRDQFVGKLVSTTIGERWHNLSANDWAKPTHWMPLPPAPEGER